MSNTDLFLHSDYKCEPSCFAKNYLLYTLGGGYFLETEPAPFHKIGSRREIDTTVKMGEYFSISSVGGTGTMKNLVVSGYCLEFDFNKDFDSENPFGQDHLVRENSDNKLLSQKNFFTFTTKSRIISDNCEISFKATASCSKTFRKIYYGVNTIQNAPVWDKQRAGGIWFAPGFGKNGLAVSINASFEEHCVTCIQCPEIDFSKENLFRIRCSRNKVLCDIFAGGQFVEMVSVVKEKDKVAINALMDGATIECVLPACSQRQEYLLCYTLSGSGLLEYDNTNYFLYADSVFMIERSKDHYLYAQTDMKWECYYITFSGYAAIAYYQQYIKNSHSILIKDYSLQLKQMFIDIIQANKWDEENKELVSSKLLTVLLTEMILQRQNSKKDRMNTPGYIQNIKAHIEQFFNKQINVEHLSKYFALSRPYLSREFKKYVGVSASEYIMLLKINYSKELLQHTEKTIDEIAYECGFNYTSQFIKMFKIKTGVTPGSYRKNTSG